MSGERIAGSGVSPKVWRAFVDVEFDCQCFIREFEAMRSHLETAAPGKSVLAAILGSKLALEMVGQRITQLLITAAGEELE